MKLFGRKEQATGEILAGGENAIANKEVEGPVSYTHLTLPTIYSV